jgi:xanthine dehydrogenase YagR molybdenum-binding subunit
MRMSADNRPSAARIDAWAKVTGSAAYTGDIDPHDALHGALALSEMPSGMVAGFDIAAAMADAEVEAIYTHENAPRVMPGPYRTWLQDSGVHHTGQPVALVLARTTAAARRAARALRPRIQAGAPAARMGDPRRALAIPAHVQDEPPDSTRGDLRAGRALSAAHVDLLFQTPAHLHAPLEPHVVLVRWLDGVLLVQTATSGIFAARRTLATALGLKSEQVRVVMPFQGGGFGAKGSAWWPTLILACSVVLERGRALRLEITREDMATVVGRRAPTEQHLRVGSDPSARLVFIEHHAIQETSPLSDYSDPTAFASRSVYACAAVQTSHRVVRANIPQPNAMRAPGEGPGSFALESALDALAFALACDPVQLRLRNLSETDPHHRRRWSSHGLAQCLRTGAARFGWQHRCAGSAPRRDPRRRMGQGVACAYYPVYQARAEARVVLHAGGRVELQCGNQDVGTGSATAMAEAAARELGLDPELLVLRYGDTDWPEAPMAAGSMGTASVIPAVVDAARDLRRRILALAAEHPRSPCHGHPAEGLWRDGLLVGGGPWIAAADLLQRLGLAEVEGNGVSIPQQQRETSASAFGAVFARVEVDARLGTVRLWQICGAYAAGRVVSPTRAINQLKGGIVFGIGMALHEDLGDLNSLALPRGRTLMNYHLPTCADVPDITIDLVDEADPTVSTLGIKGVGMIGTVGVAAAVANAVFDATGRRLTRLPLRLSPQGPDADHAAPTDAQAVRSP